MKSNSFYTVIYVVMCFQDDNRTEFYLLRILIEEGQPKNENISKEARMWLFTIYVLSIHSYTCLVLFSVVHSTVFICSFSLEKRSVMLSRNSKDNYCNLLQFKFNWFGCILQWNCTPIISVTSPIDWFVCWNLICHSDANVKCANLWEILLVWYNRKHCIRTHDQCSPCNTIWFITPIHRDNGCNRMNGVSNEVRKSCKKFFFGSND